MIAVESGVSTPFLQPDLDIAAIITPCLETQGSQDPLNDTGSVEADFDPTVALEELFHYLGEGIPQNGGLSSDLESCFEAAAIPELASQHNLCSKTGTGDELSMFSMLLDMPQPLPESVPSVNTKGIEMSKTTASDQPAPLQRPFQPPFSTPPSPMSTSEEDEKTSLPRHKRPAHKRAEVKRRGKIKTKIDDLKEILPPMQNQRKSETVILNKAAEFCRQLKMDMGRHGKEKESLQAEIVALSAEIDDFQKKLPAMGIKAKPKNKKTMEERYEEYMRREVRKNWKFWIFSFISRPLFEAYNKVVSTSSLKEFLTTVGQWTRNILGLQNLRSVVMKGVLRISKETDIMTNPENLPQQAMEAVVAKDRLNSKFSSLFILQE